MTYNAFNKFCSALAATSHIVQWGGCDVWKVGGKVFAIGGWDDGAAARFTFKVSDISYEVLKEQLGLRPAPYLASRGMKWIQTMKNRGYPTKGSRTICGNRTASCRSASRRNVSGNWA